MKSYIITNIKHGEYDVEGLKDLFQLYLIKILEKKYEVIHTEYLSSNTIEIYNDRRISFNMVEWRPLSSEVQTLMSEFIKAMSYSAYNIEVAVEFLHWDEELNEGGMMTYRMDYDGYANEDEMSVKASESLPSKINVLRHMLEDNLVPGSCIEPILTDELDKLHKELHPDVQTEVKAEETSTKATDVTICRTMSDVIEKMNKLIATVEKLEEKMLNK